LHFSVSRELTEALKRVRVRLTFMGEFAMIRFALFVFAMLAASAAQAQVYKCLDAHGATVYRQDPCPPSMKRESMSKPGIAPAPAAAPAAASGEPSGKAGKGDAKKGPMTPAEQEQAFRQRQQNAAKASKEADEKAAAAKRKEANCNDARQRLATYSLGGRVTTVDANGERTYLEDSQIAAERAKAQADISQLCN